MLKIFWRETLKERDKLDDIGTDGKMKLI